MTHRRVSLLALAIVLAAVAPASAAERLKLSETKRAEFPDRSYVLALPDAQRLGAAQVTVTENGEPVDGLRISGDGERSGVILAIDTSESMHGRAIAEAMRAARAFAARRQPQQRLGIIFFSREPLVALEPTTDGAAIKSVLARAPALTKGTQIFDAAAVAIDMLKRSTVAAGSVIVLSDGADVGSSTGPADIVAAARDARVRIFSVGLRSPSFDPVSLRAVAAAGGAYTETSTRGLAAIYARLAERLGHEFLISYRSRQPLESTVAVAVAVAGIRDVATAAYATPSFPVPPAVSKPAPSWWESATASRLVGLVVVLLLGLSVFLLFRPARQSVSRRIGEFTRRTFVTAEEDVEEAHRARALLSAADGRLSKLPRWIEFELDVELAKVPWPPRRIAVVALLGTLLLAGLFASQGSYVFAVLTLVGVPLITRSSIRFMATRTRRRFEDQLPDNLQVLASALRAGHSFIGALGVMVKDAPEPSRKEFRRVVRDENLGIPVEKSLEIVHDRMKCEDIVYVGLIATLQRETGGNTAEVLDKVVETMRERGKIRRLVRTLTAQGRLGGWIVTALPISMMVFLNLFKPDYMDPMLERTIGWVILIAAGCMVALGAYCIRRIVDIKV